MDSHPDFQWEYKDERHLRGVAHAPPLGWRLDFSSEGAWHYSHVDADDTMYRRLLVRKEARSD